MQNQNTTEEGLIFLDSKELRAVTSFIAMLTRMAQVVKIPQITSADILSRWPLLPRYSFSQKYKHTFSTAFS